MRDNNRFVDRTMTVQEAIWLDQADDDFEALVLFLESRLNEDNQDFDLRSEPETIIPDLLKECLEGVSRANEVTRCLASIANITAKEQGEN